MDLTTDFDDLYNEGIVDFRFQLRNYALANGLHTPATVDRFIREAELAVKVVFDGFGNDEEPTDAEGAAINAALAPVREG